MTRRKKFTAHVFAVSTAALCAAAANATVVSYNGFASTSGLSIVGDAATVATGDGTVLRLASATTGQSGAAYSTTPIMLGANGTFSTQFQFRFTSPGGADPADGITFVLAASPSGLGGKGNQLGYSGVKNSVAIEFDTYNNGDGFGALPDEPNSSNHVAIDTDGNMTDTAWTNVYGNGSCGFADGAPAQNPYTAAGCMSNGDLWTAKISYDGTHLNASVFDPREGSSFTVYGNYALNVGSYLGTNTAYVGFTSSTGSGYENHDIVNWQFSNTSTLPAVPEPATLFLFGAGLLGLGALIRRKKAA